MCVGALVGWDEIVDRPSGCPRNTRKDMSDEWNNWNNKIIEEFRANGGKVGGPFAGATLLILRTVGAKSGQLRESPVAYFPQDDGSMVIVASKAGLPTNPAWYHNLKANPRFEVEVGTETVPVVAEELTGGDRESKWAEIVAKAPGFGEYQKKTTRIIPLVRLTPAAA
jgi:deazaflavin-dependent oxidoreductase (nitroreductase family)